MTGKKKLPIGIESFEEIRKEGFYYVDKTGVIGQLLEKWGKVNLFTRPRRFGKSLNMSMLKAFFEIGGDPGLFEGLKISEKKELCEKYMGQFPVISISLKSVEGLDFEAAKKALKDILGEEAGRFYFLTQSSKLTNEEIESYKALLRVGETGDFLMSDTAMEKALLRLSLLLHKHYDKQVILLIDEYDVPLDKAFQYGYYDEMVSLLRNMFGNALKTNPNLYFAVLTGCLRISKESIFTGLNNLKVLTLTDVRFDEYFGFTDTEVKDMLEYYGLSGHYAEVKEWYDGYRFGNVEVYCPWDVINYCDLLRADPNALPQDYWSNTSGNAMVRRFIDKADTQTRDEIERLIGTIEGGEELLPIIQEILGSLSQKDALTTLVIELLAPQEQEPSDPDQEENPDEENGFFPDEEETNAGDPSIDDTNETENPSTGGTAFPAALVAVAAGAGVILILSRKKLSKK